MAAEPEALSIAVLHGPNLNLLGRREPEVYGTETLEGVDRRLRAEAERLGVRLAVFQANGEGALVEEVQARADTADGFLVNAAAYTHTSVALLDALLAVGRPFVEVHLTNTQAREAFRQHSLLAPRAVGLVMGFGVESYILGLTGLVHHLRGIPSSRGGQPWRA